MDYVISTAERIKSDNGHADFDKSNITFRRIILHKPKSNKMVTKKSEIESFDKDSVLNINCPDKFRPHWVI